MPIAVFQAPVVQFECARAAVEWVLNRYSEFVELDEQVLQILGDRADATEAIEFPIKTWVRKLSLMRCQTMHN